MLRMTHLYARSLRLLGASAALATTACAGLLMQPLESEPHATVEIQHQVSGMTGDSYDARVLIDDRLYDTTSYRADEIAGHPVRLRLRLEQQTITIGASTYQAGTGPRAGTEERREEYACQREECTTDNPPVCHIVDSTCIRTYSVPTYTQGQAGSRSAECVASVQIAPDVNRQYVIGFEYVSETECRATCSQRVTRADGSFERVPCPTSY